MKTLLLDDNLLSQTRVGAQLQAAGCEVVTRRQLPESGEFELVIINLGSRSMNGLELLQGTKNRFSEAQIWGFCGHLEIEIRRAALQSGVDKLLTNEGAMSELSETVRRHLGA
ncbi:MAG: response regulator [Armatimonadetes bacterium]|nr:response regulator [Armatimonadota bacterium]